MNFSKALTVTSRRHDLVAMPVRDPGESTLPNIGIITLEDAETGEQIDIDTGKRSVRLGLAGVGTIAPGAVADVVVYEDKPNREQMFTHPRMLIRRGQVIELSEHNAASHGWSQVKKVTHTVRPSFDRRSVEKLAKLHAETSSFRFERLVISDDELASQIGTEPVVHPCVPRHDVATA